MSEPPKPLRPFQWTLADPEVDVDDLEPDPADPTYTENGVPLPTKTIKAHQLRAGDRMVWTSTDGSLRPPLKIVKPMNPGISTIYVLHRGDEDTIPWSLRRDTEVRIIDQSPKFNDWGEDGL